jgi:hypothetical protein
MGNAQSFTRPATMTRLVCTKPSSDLTQAELTVEEVVIFPPVTI